MEAERATRGLPNGLSAQTLAAGGELGGKGNK